MTRVANRIWLIVLVFILFAVSGGIWFYQHTRTWLYAPIAALTVPITYDVPRGASLASVLKDMHSLGWLQHPRELSAWIRYMRPGFRLKAGEYQLNPGMSPVELAEILNSGRVVLHKVTLVEGATVADLRRILTAHPKLKSTLSNMSNAALMQQLKSNVAQPEGLFFPDTYLFAKGTTDFEIMRIAHQRMLKELNAAWNKRQPNLPLKSAYEALILASIVEKETALASERPLIAGLFIERLRRGMRLQTDPTVIYGLYESFDGDLRRADLLRDTPYNTYTRAGLPPTPICLPSGAALDAVVHPRETDALFFVATGKGDGSHYFSRTLDEHNAAVRRYLQKLRQRS